MLKDADTTIEGCTQETNRKVKYKAGMIFIITKLGGWIWEVSVCSKRKNIVLTNGLGGCRIRPLLDSLRDGAVKYLEVI